MAVPIGPHDGPRAGPVPRAAAAGDRLVWKRTRVDGRQALYGVGGTGLPVLFLHGWALGQHSYRRALRRLAGMGCRVYAPALPGFGGTADLPARRFSFAGYAEWAEQFMENVGVGDEVLVIGHSFGGGVALKLAHDCPGRVGHLVLVDSVGGSTWRARGSTIRSMAQRPLWDWGLHFPSDMLPLPQVTRVLPFVLEDAVPNAVRNPLALWRVAQLARKTDLTTELAALKERDVQVLVLWGDKDQIIPRASFDALCAAIGSEGSVVRGNHSWLLADPDAFAAVMADVVTAARAARDTRRPKTTGGTISRLRP
jgi:pimeloyl-ACP methyl ester carboxylesterase